MKGCRSFTDEETVAISGSLCARDKALFILGIKTGLRISEMLSLRIEDVYCHGTIVSFFSVKKRHTKGKMESRTMPLHPLAKQAIEQYLTERGAWEPSEALFLSERGSHAISRVQAWRVLHGTARRLDLQGTIGTHSLRKTFAQKIYNALDKDIVKTSKALGHKSLNNTVSYLSFLEEDIHKAILGL